MALVRSFVHDQARSLDHAWPGVSAVDAIDIPITMDDLGGARATITTAVEGNERNALFAHSAAAVPLIQALPRAGPAPEAVILVEPALYDLARGEDAIDAHVSVVSRAFDLAAEGDHFEAWGVLRPVMFGGPATREDWSHERTQAMRFFARFLPWDHDLDPGWATDRRVLVVTGGWNDEYELIARACAERGAQHRVLTGYAHRPQDHPDFAALVDEFLQDR